MTTAAKPLKTENAEFILGQSLGKTQNRCE